MMHPQGSWENLGIDDLDLLWCIDCLRCHGPDCPLQGRPILIRDTPTVTHAVASLPRNLDLRTIDGVRQVVANRGIVRRTAFGPLEAPVMSGDRVPAGNRLVLKYFRKEGTSVYLDTSDERRCNWMTLVTIATTAANQNLIVYQYRDNLYFTVTRDIQAGEILRVWYAPHYAAKLGKPLLNSNSSPVGYPTSAEITMTTPTSSDDATSAASPTVSSSSDTDSDSDSSEADSSETPQVTTVSTSEFTECESVTLAGENMILSTSGSTNSAPQTSDGTYKMTFSTLESAICELFTSTSRNRAPSTRNSRSTNSAPQTTECADRVIVCTPESAKCESVTSTRQNRASPTGVSGSTNLAPQTTECANIMIVFTPESKGEWATSTLQNRAPLTRDSGSTNLAPQAAESSKVESVTSAHQNGTPSTRVSRSTNSAPQTTECTDRVMISAQESTGHESVTSTHNSRASPTRFSRSTDSAPQTTECTLRTMVSTPQSAKCELVTSTCNSLAPSTRFSGSTNSAPQITECTDRVIVSTPESAKCEWATSTRQNRVPLTRDTGSTNSVPQITECTVRMTASETAKCESVILMRQSRTRSTKDSESTRSAPRNTELTYRRATRSTTRKQSTTRSTTRKQSALDTSDDRKNPEKETNPNTNSPQKSLEDSSSKQNSKEQGCDTSQETTSTQDSVITDTPKVVRKCTLTTTDGEHSVHNTRQSKRLVAVNQTSKQKYEVRELPRKEVKRMEFSHSEVRTPTRGKKVVHGKSLKEKTKKRKRKFYQILPKQKPEEQRATNRSPQKAASVKRDKKVILLSEEEFNEIEERIWDESLRSCCECSRVLENADKVKEHVINEHQEEPMQCLKCSKILISNQQLSQHVDAIHKEMENGSDVSSHRCPLCDKQLLHNRSFQSHLQTFHSRTFQCPTCQGKFWNRTKFLVHIKEHKLEGVDTVTEVMFVCDQCGREFTSLAGMKVHQSLTHVEKTFSCSYCKYSTAVEITLQEHILTNHPENDLNIRESQKFTCDVCNMVFLRSWALKHHKLNHQDLKFKCKKCDAAYRRKDSLMKHNCLTARQRMVTVKINSNSETCNMFECQKCKKLFASRASMKHHAKTHKEKRYSCSICHKAFHKRFNFNNHKYQHLRIATKEDGTKELIQVDDCGDNVKQCHLCQCHFTKMAVLIQHLQNHHDLSSDKQIHVCKPCQLVFPSAEELSTHIAQHIHIPFPEGVTLDSLHGCLICGRVFMAASILETHHLRAHSDVKSHVCEICGKSFRQANTLKAHRTTSHMDTDNKYKCKICNKSFKTSCLRLHILTHADQRDYKCPDCGRSFVQRGNFNRHVMGHHLEKKLHCKICNRAFKQADNLRRHHLVHRDYEFECHICSSKFSTQHFLTNHIRKVHEAQEACQCEYCGVKFKLLESYRRHMRRKHTEVSREVYRPVLGHR